MEQLQHLFGMICGLIALVGGLTIGFYAVSLRMTSIHKRKMAADEANYKERLARIEKGLDPRSH
jgi:hypothetical protein